MAERPDTGVFLERRSYRRRRLIDGLRLLPFLGAWLFLLPVFWPADGTEQAPSMSVALYYVFGAWLALIVACGTLVMVTRLLGRREGVPQVEAENATPDENRRS